jgi:hypothetical protein
MEKHIWEVKLIHTGKLTENAKNSPKFYQTMKEILWKRERYEINRKSRIYNVHFIPIARCCGKPWIFKKKNSKAIPVTGRGGL